MKKILRHALSSNITTSSIRILATMAIALLVASGCAAEQAKSKTPVRTEIPKLNPAPGPNEIKFSLERNLDRVQQCFVAGTFKNAALKGTVQVTFILEPTGKVSDIFDDGSSITDLPVVECVMDIVKHTRFPSGGRFSQEITYPFRFAGQS